LPQPTPDIGSRSYHLVWRIADVACDIVSCGRLEMDVRRQGATIGLGW
jgi:hypothetical protein